MKLLFVLLNSVHRNHTDSNFPCNFTTFEMPATSVMPSPSADSKFVLSILKFFKHAQFFNHTQNIFGMLKSGILLHKLDYLSILKIF